MAIAVFFDFPGESIEKYDQALAEAPDLRSQPAPLRGVGGGVWADSPGRSPRVPFGTLLHLQPPLSFGCYRK
jgi:hypothetical protein